MTGTENMVTSAWNCLGYIEIAIGTSWINILDGAVRIHCHLDFNNRTAEMILRSQNIQVIADLQWHGSLTSGKFYK